MVIVYTTIAEAIFEAAQNQLDAIHLCHAISHNCGTVVQGGSFEEQAKKRVRYSMPDGSELITEKDGTYYVG